VSWSEAFLGIIALATLVMALIQVGAVVVMLRLARQAQQTIASAKQTMTTVQQDIRPLIAKATIVADEASRTAALATAQAEKIDRLVTDLSVRVDQTAAVVQEAIVTPAREGAAIVAALKAALGALRGYRDLRPRHGRTADEEDPLFIG
jgi:predicted PurR-regulated permease PerM